LLTSVLTAGEGTRNEVDHQHSCTLAPDGHELGRIEVPGLLQPVFRQLKRHGSV
jgi:hypothetical protein